MSVTPEDVEHIAFLARVGLTEAEKKMLQEQLSAILEHMRALNELDTSGIPPTAQVIPLTTVMRADEIGPCLLRDEVLANAPDTDGEYFRVPPVLD